MSNSASSVVFTGENARDFYLIAKLIPHYEEYNGVLASVLVRELKDVENPAIVDIGCGQGQVLGLLAKTLGNSRLVGIDISSDMIEIAKSKLATNAADSPAKLFCTDALDWFRMQPGGSIDAFVSSWTFHNWNREYRSSIFSELSRVLVAGGLFVNADKIAQRDESRQQSAFEGQIDQFFDALQNGSRYGSFLRRWVMHYLEDERTDRRFTEVENDDLHKLNDFSVPKKLRRDLMDAIYVSRQASRIVSNDKQ